MTEQIRSFEQASSWCGCTEPEESSQSTPGTFNPTHTFRGLPLRMVSLDREGTAQLIDEDRNEYRLPESVVTKIKPRPKPGEVWKYVGGYAGNSDHNLVLVTEDAKATFVNVEGDSIQFLDGDLPSDFVKVLNADGTPA